MWLMPSAAAPPARERRPRSALRRPLLALLALCLLAPAARCQDPETCEVRAGLQCVHEAGMRSEHAEPQPLASQPGLPREGQRAPAPSAGPGLHPVL